MTAIVVAAVVVVVAATFVLFGIAAVGRCGEIEEGRDVVVVNWAKRSLSALFSACKSYMWEKLLTSGVGK